MPNSKRSECWEFCPSPLWQAQIISHLLGLDTSDTIQYPSGNNRRGSGSELAQVLMRHREHSLDVLLGLFVIWVSPDHPTVILLRELEHPRLVLPLLHQHLRQGTIHLRVFVVIASHVEEGRALCVEYHGLLGSLIQVLNLKGGVDGSDGDQIVELSRKPEGEPSSQAVGCCKALCVAQLVQMVGQFGISGGEAFHREGLLNEADDFGGIHFSHVGIIQQFRHIHVIPQSGIGVADDLVPARVDAEDVLEDDEDAGALADVVDLESGDVLVLADGLVVEGEGRPGARRTAFELGLVAALAGVFGIAVDATHVNFT